MSTENSNGAVPYPIDFRELISIGGLMILSQEELLSDPRFILWIEMLVGSHLVGRPAPKPDQEWLEELKSQTSSPVLEEAIGQRIEISLADREPGLSDYYRLEDLAAHLRENTNSCLQGKQSSCDGTEIEWQAGRYRWFDVIQKLQQAINGEIELAADQPHPETEEWARRGLELESKTLIDQWDELRQRPDYQNPPDYIIFGKKWDVNIWASIFQLSQAEHPEDRFLEATKFLNLGTTWARIAFAIPEKEEAA